MPTPRDFLAFFRGAVAAALLAGLCLAVSACSDDDMSPPPPTATAVPTNTSAPTPTNTATPTATSTPEPTATVTPEHAEILFGSTEPGGGALNTMYDEDHAHLDFDTCLGGEGDDCIGGIAIYSGDDPGYERVDEDMPAESLYTLVDGTTVSLVVVAIDDGMSLRKDGATADAPGETLLLGTIPALDHTHVEYVATVPGGTTDFEKHVTIQLFAAGDTYAPSAEIPLTFKPDHD